MCSEKTKFSGLPNQMFQFSADAQCSNLFC
jgi:hypothetical protein